MAPPIQTAQLRANQYKQTPAQVWNQVRQRFFRNKAQDSLPLSITHQRIYILPSRRGLLFLFSLLIMLVASMNYAISLGYALCFLLTGLFSASLIATYRNIAGLVLNSCSEPRAFQHQTLDFRLGFTNPNHLPRYSLEIQDSNNNANRFNISAKQTTVVNLKISAHKRGYQALGRTVISSNYPLGLWRTWSYIHTTCQGLGIPSPEPKVPDFSVIAFDQDSKQSQTIGQSDYIGIKPYQNGDPKNAIAWKAVAKGLGWYSKEFSSTQQYNELIFRWSDIQNLHNTEQRLSRLCAWVIRAEQEQCRYGLELPGAHLELGLGESHKQKCLEILALYPGTQAQHD